VLLLLLLGPLWGVSQWSPSIAASSLPLFMKDARRWAAKWPRLDPPAKVMDQGTVTMSAPSVQPKPFPELSKLTVLTAAVYV
jgi:hypothetical protein